MRLFQTRELKELTRFVFSLSMLLLSGRYLPTASAQEVHAQMRGEVTDPSAAPVPGATVQATNTQTTSLFRTQTGADGSFQFLQLPVGNYNVSITKDGFQTFTENGVALVLNQVYAVSAQLQLGRVSELISVQADPVQVETATTQLGTVINATNIVNLPLNGRNWTQLQQLAPGVVAASDRNNTYATNGSQSQQNSYLINGADSMDIMRNLPSIIPSPDSIQEFNLIDSTINPEFGRNSGGILNAVLKSGTNEFHGSAFEFYRDTFLNSRNLFQQSKPVFHQNQFGGTVGGPIWKNHTFFFASYQGTRFRQPQSGVSSQTTVFTPEERDGYFPNLATSSGTSPVPLVGEDGQTYAAGVPYSIIFPTGHVPTVNFNPISQRLLSVVPLPNSPGGLYSFNPIQAGTQDQGIARIDHSFTWQDAVWASLFFENSPTISTLPAFGATLPGFGQRDSRAYKQITADWTHTFNPTMLNEFRASYLRYNYQAVYPQTPTLPSSAGFTNILPQYPAGAGLPFIGVAGYFNLGFSTQGPQPRIDENYQLTDSVSKVIGNHTLKFGFDGKRYNVNNPFLSQNNGYFTFAASGPYSTGDPGADFLLGIPDSYQQSSGGWIMARTYEYYAYAQDNWKVNRNLTLNYGAGYQIDTPLVNQHFNSEAVNCFRPGQQSTVFPTAPLGLVFPGDTGCSASGYYSHYDHVGPRFGFAYAPGHDGAKRFVVRGGFGVYFNRTEEELTLQNLGAAPFSLTSYGIAGAAGNLGILNPSPSFADPYRDIATGQSTPNPFPFTPAARGSNVDFSLYEPLGINVIDPKFTSPYAMNYNLNIQKELPASMLLQLGYVASLGRHLEMTYEGNPISPAGQAACAADPSCVANRANQHVLYPEHALNAPGDVFASVGVQATNGVSSYNSFQVSLQKRLSHGLSFLAAYTWSHAIDDTSGYENSSYGYRGINPFNFALNKGDSAYDARQRLVVSYDYEIPHLSRFWNHTWSREIFDGWHLAGITTLQTGFPINIADTGFRSLSCDSFTYYGCPDAPNTVAPAHLMNPRTSTAVNGTRNAGNTQALPYYWFDPNAFALETIGTFGNAGRNSLHGPGINNTDLSLSKRFLLPAAEHRFLELRLETFNLANHTQFSTVSTTNGGSGVNGDINSGNFGRVLSAMPGRTVQLGAKLYF
jgi:hypothetical protein